MAFITYPLNNIDYTAEDAELFHCTRTSGIWAEDSFPISVTGADNNVTIGKGIAWINNEEFSGKVTALKSAEVLDLGIADSTYPRIDVIAIQFNANNNATDVIIKKGTPATNPVRPSIVRTGAIYELYLASVYRPTGATAITASNITDLRMDKTVCGLMADSVTSVDTYAIDAQVKALIANLEAEIQGVKDTSGLMFESEWVNNGTIPVSKGGTGVTTLEDLKNLVSEEYVETDVFTNRFSQGKIMRFGKIKRLRLIDSIAGFKAGTSYELGTLDEEYRPIATPVFKVIPISGNTSTIIFASLVVAVNGTVTFTPYSDRTNGTTIRIDITYI